MCKGRKHINNARLQSKSQPGLEYIMPHVHWVTEINFAELHTLILAPRKFRSLFATGPLHKGGCSLGALEPQRLYTQASQSSIQIDPHLK